MTSMACCIICKVMQPILGHLPNPQTAAIQPTRQLSELVSKKGLKLKITTYGRMAVS